MWRGVLIALPCLRGKRERAFSVAGQFYHIWLEPHPLATRWTGRGQIRAGKCETRVLNVSFMTSKRLQICNSMKWQPEQGTELHFGFMRVSYRHALENLQKVDSEQRQPVLCLACLLLFWQSCCWSRCLRPVVTGCCRPSLHVSVRQALPDLSSAGGLPAPRRGPPLHHIPSNYWHPAAFEHTGIIVKNSRGQTADGEGWKQQSLSKREKKEKRGKKSEKLFVSLMPA